VGVAKRAPAGSGTGHEAAQGCVVRPCRGPPQLCVPARRASAQAGSMLGSDRPWRLRCGAPRLVDGCVLSRIPLMPVQRMAPGA